MLGLQCRDDDLLLSLSESLLDVCTTCVCVYSVAADSTGTHSLYTRYQDYEIMFHVSTMLPYTANNTQQVKVAQIREQTFAFLSQLLKLQNRLVSLPRLSSLLEKTKFSLLISVHSLAKALEKASVLPNRHDIKILPPSVHFHKKRFSPLPHRQPSSSGCEVCGVILFAVIYKDPGNYRLKDVNLL